MLEADGLCIASEAGYPVRRKTVSHMQNSTVKVQVVLLLRLHTGLLVACWVTLLYEDTLISQMK